VTNGLDRFSLAGRTAIVTGGTGVLGGAIATGVAAAGANVAVLGRRREVADHLVDTITAGGGTALAVSADVLDRDQLSSARAAVLDAWGGIDILVNAAGGNRPGAMVHDEQTFFAIAREAFDEVLALNLTGTLLPCQVFGEAMAERPAASIINISSMAAVQAITRVVGYGAAKAGVENLTRWLAVDLARRYGDSFRVNAIAPGFFLGEQNRALLVDDDGGLTPRGETIIANTPAGRFGEPDELVGTAVWLAGDASRFVTGAVIPVDGGFSVFSGV
jgi:NAD(P)-dependent dehydrogenase (short-subunit alcohol dehydrogenase family)